MVLRVWAAGGAPCVSGAAWRASLRGRSPNGTRAKAQRRAKCYKKVRIARGDANCARAYEGGGRGETLVLLSVLTSRDTRVHTARYGSSRRRCSFLAAAATAWSQNGPIRRSSELKKWDIVGPQRFFTRPKKRALRCQYGAKRPKLTETGYYL
jgi:hypothetical protein